MRSLGKQPAASCYIIQPGHWEPFPRETSILSETSQPCWVKDCVLGRNKAGQAGWGLQTKPEGDGHIHVGTLVRQAPNTPTFLSAPSSQIPSWAPPPGETLQHWLGPALIPFAKHLSSPQAPLPSPPSPSAAAWVWVQTGELKGERDRVRPPAWERLAGRCKPPPWRLIHWVPSLRREEAGYKK